MLRLSLVALLATFCSPSFAVPNPAKPNLQDQCLAAAVLVTSPVTTTYTSLITTTETVTDIIPVTEEITEYVTSFSEVILTTSETSITNIPITITTSRTRVLAVAVETITINLPLNNKRDEEHHEERGVACPVTYRALTKLPSYASACRSSSGYASACSRLGVTAQITTPKAPLITKTCSKTITITPTTTIKPTLTVSVTEIDTSPIVATTTLTSTTTRSYTAITTYTPPCPTFNLMVDYGANQGTYLKTPDNNKLAFYNNQDDADSFSFIDGVLTDVTVGLGLYSGASFYSMVQLSSTAPGGYASLLCVPDYRTMRCYSLNRGGNAFFDVGGSLYFKDDSAGGARLYLHMVNCRS
ncbi:hypothetical protein G7Z17_g1048 [Cylindrodendrum hubeiense]|uniref:Uncharacterized protein n=1 Tax=Cylindrodendrum hubeiense TaxID=595255 RepID=A0A9P5LMH8_9HYPO|nr:hypothetical protein G7Z17_g1048 [Cylindrodendrum hubeiense]